MVPEALRGHKLLTASLKLPFALSLKAHNSALIVAFHPFSIQLSSPSLHSQVLCSVVSCYYGQLAVSIHVFHSIFTIYTTKYLYHHGPQKVEDCVCGPWSDG